MFSPLRAPLIYSIALVSACLAGCGQKGPLFMPVKQPVTAPAPVVKTPPVQPVMPSSLTTDNPANTATPSPR